MKNVDNKEKLKNYKNTKNVDIKEKVKNEKKIRKNFHNTEKGKK